MVCIRSVGPEKGSSFQFRFCLLWWFGLRWGHGSLGLMFLCRNLRLMLIFERRLLRHGCRLRSRFLRWLGLLNSGGLDFFSFGAHERGWRRQSTLTNTYHPAHYRVRAAQFHASPILTPHYLKDYRTKWRDRQGPKNHRVLSNSEWHPPPPPSLLEFFSFPSVQSELSCKPSFLFENKTMKIQTSSRIFQNIPKLCLITFS